MDYALRIQRRGEIGGSAVAAPAVRERVPSGVSGPRTGQQKGLGGAAPREFGDR
jgi:hypothetical protein